MNVHDLPSNVGSWFLTDSDCAQYCRRLSPTMYEFTQIVWLDTTVDTDKTYCVTQSVEDVGDMTLDEISGHISSYYQTLSKMVESYGGLHDTGKNALTVTDYCQLIAECAFENEVGNNSISEVMDWNRCVDFQRGYMLSQ
nr:MAG TPA: hypothetical protein [Caudoviricetes sp.]